MDQRPLQQQSQKMHLSPQLRQYLKFLYLPQMELRELLQQELSDNPALEEIPSVTTSETENADSPDEKRDEKLREEPEEEPNDIDFARRNRKEMQSLHQFQETLLTKDMSLADYLMRQVSFRDWNEDKVQIAKQIIGNLDDEGFLRTDVNEIALEIKSTASVVEEVLKQIQEFEPTGIAARSLEECLQIQLRKKFPSKPHYEQIVTNHLQDVARRDSKTLARKMNITLRDAEDAIEQISKLDPRPARNFRETKHLQIIPDAQILFKGSSQNEFDIEIFKECLPRFRLSPDYRRMLRDPKIDTATKTYLKTKISDGSQLMKALELRESTLRLITQEIVKTQQDFFVHGFSHLKPLRLKDLAESLGMHPSTISRAIHEKYVMTPQGTLPFKSFFSQRVETTDGEDESQKSIMLRIQKMIEEEDPAHPLSDQIIAEKLCADQVTIARRTVAKYRELLKILPTHLRRRRN